MMMTGAYRVCEVLQGSMPVMGMVLVQISYVGMNIFYKIAADDGMNLRVLIAYRMIFATAFIAPPALIFERKSRPKLTWMILFQAFLSGLFGGLLAQNLYIESLVLTSATFASAMSNFVPAITFILAFCFRMEKLGVETLRGKAKVLGTLMGIGGAMVLTFYKGKEIGIWSTHVHLLHKVVRPRRNLGSHILGSLSSLGSSFSFAIWLIIQAKMSKRYPCPYSSTALMSLMASIQSVVFALCLDGDWKQWKLGFNIRLYASAYAGIVASGVVLTITTWCLAKRGPVFVSIFNPLSPLLIAIAGSLVLDEKLNYGSILGAALIVCGLYAVLWGKGEDTKQKTDELPMVTVPSKTSQGSQPNQIVNNVNAPFTSNYSTTNGVSFSNDKDIKDRV